MGDFGPRQGKGESNRATVAASAFSPSKPPPLIQVPAPRHPAWSGLPPPDKRHITAPREGPGATFDIADFNPATDQLAILADPSLTRLTAVTTLSPPNATTTRLRLDFIWTDRPQDPGYALFVLVPGPHTITLQNLAQIAAPARSADWITLHPTPPEPITIPCPGGNDHLHLVEISQVYDPENTPPKGRFLEHVSRFYIYAAPPLTAADIIAPFKTDDWGRLAQLPGVRAVYEVILPPRHISPDTDTPRDTPIIITDRDLASYQSLNYHY